jgi:pyridoxamine 5'-phosphate oxidase
MELSASIRLTQRIVTAAPAQMISTNTDHALDASALRRDYRRDELLEADAGPDPFALFRCWFSEALEAGIDEPNAFALSTVMTSGRPSSRIVLLKGADNEGFVFFTNYESSKGEQIAGQDAVSLLFFWAPLERQIRIEGYAVKLDDTESDAYFRSRPLGSRIGAWASPQSRVIESRAVLEDLAAYYQAHFGDNPPRPPHWGGYRVVPDSFEFWQGRSSRLHDRLRYQREAPSPKCAWRLERLAP